MFRVFRVAVCVSLSTAAVFGIAGAREPVPLQVLTVGGGPRPDHNQAAIESNVRYVAGLLPTGAQNRVLFADGNPQTQCVLYSDVPKNRSEAERAFRLLFNGTDAEEHYRAPRLPAQNGPSQVPAIHAEMERLAQTGSNPALLYFTGHGDRKRDLDNNVYALWETEQNPNAGLSVRQLAGEIARLPQEKPVTLVMVQCFSGAFGNVLFEDGDPRAALVDRPICGFFATTRERMAAGCTPEINEADYKDFTSYFFAALSGRDRLGRTVTGADYNKDGRVGMDEAFAYSLITEPSADVPVCTSDVFLRRYLPIPDDEVARLPYSQVRQMANPWQQAALDGLSRQLGEAGENRLKVALADVRTRNEGQGEPTATTTAMREARDTLEETRDDLAQRFPSLKRRRGGGPEQGDQKAVAFLEQHPQTVRRVRDAARVWQSRYEAQEGDELRGVRYLRLMRVAKSVVLEKRLRNSGNAELVARFDKLRALEAQNPLR